MDMNIETVIAISAMDHIAPISRQIWDAKYRLKDADGTPVDLTIEDSWRACGPCPRRRGDRARPVGSSPSTRRCKTSGFLPAGRILSGAGAAPTGA